MNALVNEIVYRLQNEPKCTVCGTWQVVYVDMGYLLYYCFDHHYLLSSNHICAMNDLQASKLNLSDRQLLHLFGNAYDLGKHHERIKAAIKGQI